MELGRESDIWLEGQLGSELALWLAAMSGSWSDRRLETVLVEDRLDDELDVGLVTMSD